MVSVAMTDMSLRHTSHQANFRNCCKKQYCKMQLLYIDHNLWIGTINKGLHFLDKSTDKIVVSAMTVFLTLLYILC